MMTGLRIHLVVISGNASTSALARDSDYGGMLHLINSAAISILGRQFRVERSR